jgi:hypothetical protein
MKNIFYALCFIGFSLYAQVNTDPLIGVYSKTGESSEIFMSYVDTSKSFSNNSIINIDTSLNSSSQQFIGKNDNINILKTASVTGDLDGDFKDEVVTVHDTIIKSSHDTTSGILITIYWLKNNFTVNKFFSYLEAMPQCDINRIRICTGNFDDDYKQEFAICYGPDKDDSLVISVYKYDTISNIHLLASFKNIAFYDRNFDISSGNLDEYFRDEIVLVKNSAPISDKIDNPTELRHIATTKYDLYILKYDPATKKLLSSYFEKNISTDHYTISTSLTADYFFNDLRVACGDMNVDNKDEINVGLSFIQGFKDGSGWNDTYFFTFLHRFWFLENGSLAKADYYKLSHDYTLWHNKYPVWPEYPLRTLTLKCEQFDNLAGDEIIVNNYDGLRIYNEVGDERNLNELYKLENGFLNTYGNECFTITDLNPDTTQKYCNKEIITLETNVSHRIDWPTSSDAYEGGAFLMVYTFSDSSSIVLKEKKKFSIDTSKIVRVTALNPGDFDFDCGEVLFLGTPEIIQTKIQQPIVIMNCPPIHYDILDGTPHDLNKAYATPDDPPFYASYYNEKGGKETTSISTQNSYGFSNEWKNYRMIGGNGFEKTTILNTQENSTYFQGYEQQKSIGNKLDVFTEDWILCSELDYRYYRYPIYNMDLKRLGYFGILSPHSGLIYSWKSGNSYNNFGYCFDHEPCNILSYKSIVNSQDFSQEKSGFVSNVFANQITISNSSHGEFSFTFKDVCDTGSTYNYQSQLGRNDLTKSGYEATVGLEMGFTIKSVFSISVSNYINMNIGASSDIAENFSQSDLYTHNTELSESFSIEGVLGNLATLYNNSARYKVTPYIYRSQCGAIVLDYLVELDPEYMSWWTANYSGSSDLAFIIPLKYGSEHGESTLPSQKQKTNEIQFYPQVAAPGDTICIVTRVHNYSLKPFIDTLKVDYYLGDPQTNGVKISDIHGSNRISKFVHLDYYGANDSTDFEENLTFFWKIPETLTCSPRIYAIIDPDSAVEEIHKNNNIGWNKLPIYGCNECSYSEPVTGIKKETVNQIAFNVSIYPNPFNSSASIMFSLSKPERVKIEIYSLTGVKAGVIKDQLYTTGEHTIRLDGSNLTEGMYLLKATAGENVSIMKISLLQ